MQERQQSKYINLRNFHNYIKCTLISNCSTYIQKTNKGKPVTLFDISVGRMGDYHSWNKSKITYVFGVDPDEESIREANVRLFNIKQKKYNKTNVDLDIGKITDDYFEVTFPKFKQFNIVSCQFTIHYFFEKQEMFDNALRRIVESLKPGGYFIGTTIDGNKMNDVL